MPKINLVLIIFILQKLQLTQQTDCKNLLTMKLFQNFFCDKYIISNLQYQIDSVRKFNKYLSYRIQTNKQIKEDVCGTATETFNKCPKREMYATCQDAVIKNGEGAFLIDPTYVKMEPFMAYCVPDANGGNAWLVIQRRINAAVSFNRKWTEYVKGFGDLYESHWLGLQTISNITNSIYFELWVEITDKNGVKKNARYKQFGLGTSLQNYNLLTLGNYNGDAGDALRDSQGFGFSTFDQNVENERERNSMDLKSKRLVGWWCGGSNCNINNLNAEYDALKWMDIREIRRVQMAIRQISSTTCS